MKRSTLAAAALIFLAGLFTGCSGRETAGPVEFEFWFGHNQSDRIATAQVLVDTYMAINPNVTIKVIPVEENDLAGQINAASAAGNLPPLIEAHSEAAVSFGAEGIMDTEAVGTLLDEMGRETFYPGTLKLFETGKGDYYALPYHGWVQGIWYRSDWFEEAGLEPPNTWENILKAAKYFYDPQDNQYGVLVGTTAENYSEQCFTHLALANGAQLFDREGNLIFNSPEMKETVEFYAELAQYNPPGPQYWRARDYYIQGKMAMFFYSTYIMDDLALEENAANSLTNENFEELEGSTFDPDLVAHTKMVSQISNTKPAGYGTVNALCLLKQDDPAVTRAARDFVRYLYTPNAYITYLHMQPGGLNPVIKEIADNPRYQNDPNGIFKHYGVEKMTEIIEGMNSIETFSIVEGVRIDRASKIFNQKIIPQMLYKVTQEGMDVEAAMDWAEQEMMKVE
ncbi:MAG: extracellular solute-binding protein [Spirochaetales bacterium]|nr:extracellular solute-binding protein [Spirochaetales bacterium]